MAPVNANVRVQLPAATAVSAQAEEPTAPERDVTGVGVPASGFIGGLSSMAQSVGNTLTDVGTIVGVDTNEDGSLRAGVDPLHLGGFSLAAAGPTALMSLRNRVDPLTGATSSFADRFGATAASNSIKVTPTLVSAVLGPAIADGVSMIAPNLVKKYKDTKDIKVAEEKKAAEKTNQRVKIERAVAGGLVVGLAAGAVFLLKPDVFKKFGAGVTHAIEGSTKFRIGGAGGVTHKLSGVLDDTAIRASMEALGRPIASGTAVEVLKTVSPMARDAVFSNRLLAATAGGVGTVLLANKAAGEQDPDKQRMWWGITAAAGAATVGGTWGIGKLTQRSQLAANGAGGLLAKNDLFMKPNVEWVKKYATTIAPITAVPAGSAASQYFNIVNDFDEITAAKSPFRK
jgi:hypothetical protein